MVIITRVRGDTAADKIIVQDSAGLAIDITGFTFLLTVSPDQKPTTAVNELYSLAGVITNALQGTVEFVPTVTEANQLGKFFYDIQMTDAGGRIKTIAKDKYTYTQDITK